MHQTTLLSALALALLIAGLTVVARRVHVISPILLLVVGALLAFTPGIPQLILDPELVLLTLLPPLLYSSGVGMSWRGFHSNLRPILLLQSAACCSPQPRLRRSGISSLACPGRSGSCSAPSSRPLMRSLPWR